MNKQTPSKKPLKAAKKGKTTTETLAQLEIEERRAGMLEWLATDEAEKRAAKEERRKKRTLIALIKRITGHGIERGHKASAIETADARKVAEYETAENYETE